MRKNRFWPIPRLRQVCEVWTSNPLDLRNSPSGGGRRPRCLWAKSRGSPERIGSNRIGLIYHTPGHKATCLGIGGSLDWATVLETIQVAAKRKVLGILMEESMDLLHKSFWRRSAGGTRPGSLKKRLACSIQIKKHISEPGWRDLTSGNVLGSLGIHGVCFSILLVCQDDERQSFLQMGYWVVCFPLYSLRPSAAWAPCFETNFVRYN